MKEVEVKAKIKNIRLINKRLVDLGAEFISKSNQIDEVYIGNKVTLPRINARIRFENKAYTLTIKEKLSNSLDNNEFEFKITNPKDARKLLVTLGFKKLTNIKKIRSLYKYNQFTICLDKVKDLGNFIEVEILAKETTNSKVIQEKILNFLEKLNVKKEDKIIASYHQLLINKKI